MAFSIGFVDTGIITSYGPRSGHSWRRRGTSQTTRITATPSSQRGTRAAPTTSTAQIRSRACVTPHRRAQGGTAAQRRTRTRTDRRRNARSRNTSHGLSFSGSWLGPHTATTRPWSCKIRGA